MAALSLDKAAVACGVSWDRIGRSGSLLFDFGLRQHSGHLSAQGFQFGLQFGLRGLLGLRRGLGVGGVLARVGVDRSGGHRP